MLAALYIIGLIVMFVIGISLGSYKSHDKSVGTLRIDRSEPDEAPLLFLELATDPRNIMDKKHITLDISTESYLSHE